MTGLPALTVVDAAGQPLGRLSPSQGGGAFLYIKVDEGPLAAVELVSINGDLLQLAPTAYRVLFSLPNCAGTPYVDTANLTPTGARPAAAVPQAGGAGRLLFIAAGGATELAEYHSQFERDGACASSFGSGSYYRAGAAVLLANPTPWRLQ